MQRKTLNINILNNNLNLTSIINKYYLGKISKDKKQNFNNKLLNKFCFLLFLNNKKQNFNSYFLKNLEKKINFFKKVNFFSYEKKLTFSKKVNLNLYNTRIYKKKIYIKRNLNNKVFLKTKFNKFLFLKTNKIRKCSLFFNNLINKLYFLSKNNISDHVKITIYKIISLLLFFSNNKFTINSATFFLKKLYFKSKKQKKLSGFFVKSSHKKNYKNVDYSFIKFYKNLLVNYINTTHIGNNSGKKKIISFIFYLFKFNFFDYYTNNKKLIAKTKLFLNSRKTKKIRRRINNNFFYKKKLYINRLNEEYYSSLTKHKSVIKKKIKNKIKINYIYKKKHKKNILYNLVQNKKLSLTEYKYFLKSKNKMLKLYFNVNNIVLKNSGINKNIKDNNLYNQKILKFIFIYKKLLVLNNILKNFKKYAFINLNYLNYFVKYLLFYHNKLKYNKFIVKKIDSNNINLFFYDNYMSNLIDQYKKKIITDNYDILSKVELYKINLKSLFIKDIIKKMKIKHITYAHMNLIKYLNFNININGEFVKYIKTLKKKIKTKKKKNYLTKKRINFKKKYFNIVYSKYKNKLYHKYNKSNIIVEYQVKSNLNYHLNHFYNISNLNYFNNLNKSLYIYYNITTKNTRYLISNSNYKILKSNSLGLLKIDRKEMRQKKSKLKLAEFFLNDFKILFKKNKNKKLFNEFHFHLTRHKYFTYLIFKLFRKYIRKKIKKIEKKKKKYFAKIFINMIYFFKKKIRRKKKTNNIYSNRYNFKYLLVKK